jgi:hypothetical protein
MTDMEFNEQTVVRKSFHETIMMWGRTNYEMHKCSQSMAEHDRYWPQGFGLHTISLSIIQKTSENVKPCIKIWFHLKKCSANS